MIDSQVIKLYAWLLDNVLLAIAHIGTGFEKNSKLIFFKYIR